MQINNLGVALELRLGLMERSLLCEALQRHSVSTKERQALDVIHALCTTLKAIDPDDGDVGSLYIRTVDVGLLSDALRSFGTYGKRKITAVALTLQNMITTLELAMEVAG